jgi:hypothetical protein
VLASLEGGNHAFGPNCAAFEQEFAAWNGNRFAVTTNSGTAALHMAVAACGCGAGDEVIVPAYSWSSSATCVLHHNCIPVFVDIDYDTMNIDVSAVESAITERTKAILVGHLHGLPVNMEHVCRIAGKHGLKVIEDACQAHGAEFKGRKVGLWVEPEGHRHNWYNFTCRVDPSPYGHSGPTGGFRDAVMAAIQAEGAPVGIWRRYALPSMTVFQARNAYGKGCPWECPNSRRLCYEPRDFPAAQKHCDAHFGMTAPLRAPNDESVARLVGGAIRKVFENMHDLDVEKAAGGG